MEIIKPDLLLFSKEIAPRGFKYRLYFVYLPTLKNGIPRIHRLICKKRSLFAKAELGKVYQASYKKVFLKSLDETGEADLAENHYRVLLDRRNERFKRSYTLSAFDKLQTEHLFGNAYYTFEETRQILSFKPSLLNLCGCQILRLLILLLSLLIPMAAFILSFYYFTAVFEHAANYLFGYLLLPFYYFLAVPFLIFLMILFTTLSEGMLLRLDYFRWIMLQRQIYSTGGMRRGITLHKKQKSRLLLYGLITGGLYVFILVFMFL